MQDEIQRKNIHLVEISSLVPKMILESQKWIICQKIIPALMGNKNFRSLRQEG